MSNEFKVIVEVPLEETLRAEIADAIKAAVLQKLAKMDSTKHLSIIPLAGGGGSTDGIKVRAQKN